MQQCLLRCVHNRGRQEIHGHVWELRLDCGGTVLCARGCGEGVVLEGVEAGDVGLDEDWVRVAMDYYEGRADEAELGEGGGCWDAVEDEGREGEGVYFDAGFKR